MFLSSETLFFLDSTFGITSGLDLNDSLQDEEFPDRDMIIEMLLFPDQTSRLAIEPLLESAGLELTEELEITGFLRLHADGRPSLACYLVGLTGHRDHTPET